MNLTKAIALVRPTENRVGQFVNEDGSLSQLVTLYLVDGKWLSERSLRQLALRLWGQERTRQRKEQANAA